MTRSGKNAAAALCATWLVAAGLARADHHLSAGEKAPGFTLPTYAGGTISLDALRGRVVIVDFWGTWCPPCAKELPALAALYQKMRGQGIEVVAVNLDQDRSDVARFLAKMSLPFVIALDPKGDVAGAYDPANMPTSYVVGRDGTVRYINPGFHDGDERQIQAAVERELASK